MHSFEIMRSYFLSYLIKSPPFSFFLSFFYSSFYVCLGERNGEMGSSPMSGSRVGSSASSRASSRVTQDFEGENDSAEQNRVNGNQDGNGSGKGSARIDPSRIMLNPEEIKSKQKAKECDIWAAVIEKVSLFISLFLCFLPIFFLSLFFFLCGKLYCH